MQTATPPVQTARLVGWLRLILADLKDLDIHVLHADLNPATIAVWDGYVMQLRSTASLEQQVWALNQLWIWQLLGTTPTNARQRGHLRVLPQISSN